jgi:hypothetical protein
MLVDVLGNDLVQKTKYDELENKMVVQTTYDNSAVLKLNAQERAEKIGGPQYKGNLAHVGRIHEGDIIRLANMGYDVLSPDPEESRRALLYIQSNEPHLLTVNGKPFSKKRAKWV